MDYDLKWHEKILLKLLILIKINQYIIFHHMIVV